MSGKVFVDTNILVYAHDLDAGQKHQTARKSIETLWENRCGMLSTQVMQEFYITLTRKITRPVPGNTVRSILRNYLSWQTVVNDPGIIFLAGEIQEQNRISFWDALIVSAAFSGNAGIILSEDLHHEQLIQGIRIQNPFMDPLVFSS